MSLHANTCHEQYLSALLAEHHRVSPNTRSQLQLLQDAWEFTRHIRTLIIAEHSLTGYSHAFANREGGEVWKCADRRIARISGAVPVPGSV